MTGAAFGRLVDRLRENGRKVTARAGRAEAQCPAHEDRNPSLSIRQIEGSVLLHCHGGCHVDDVLAALGMGKADLYDDPKGARYDYFNASGTRTVRTVTRTPDKRFRQRVTEKGTASLFRLPQVIAAVAGGHPIYLVEGEKDVLALESIGLVATTAPMGAINFSKADVSPLAGAQVIAIVDKDEAGQKWAAQVADALRPVVKELSFKEAASGKDAADHVVAGLGVDDLIDVEMPEDVAGAEETSLRRARITWASEIEPEPVTWAWEESGEGRMPAGSLSMAAGREGTGKSSFGIWMTAQITRGTLPGSFYGRRLRVFYVAVEDSWKHTLIPRLIAAGADLSRVGRFEVITDTDGELVLSLPRDLVLLEAQIRENEVVLVVIDPLMSVIGEKIDTHREREVRSALDPLTRLADRTGALILGIAHFNKGNGADAASLITGSGAFKNVPRSVFGFARDDTDGTRVMSQVKNSLGRDDLASLSYEMQSADIQTPKGIARTAKFVFTGTSERSVADVLRDAQRSPDQVDERRDAASFIRTYLVAHGGTADANDVLAAGKDAGYNEKTLKNARNKVAGTDSRGFNEKVWTWTLREGPVEGPEGPTHQRPGPSGPTAGPSGSDDLSCCVVCGQRLHPVIAAEGAETCPNCDLVEAAATTHRTTAA